MVAERGDTPPQERRHGDRNREGRGAKRDRGDHDRSRGGDRDRDSRRNRDDMTKDDTEAYEQQATDAREYAVKLKFELHGVYAGIFALMDKNLIPSTRAGESKMFYYKMKGDYDRYLAELAIDEADTKDVDAAVMLQKQEPMIHEVRKTVEVPQVQYVDEIIDESVVAQRQVPPFKPYRIRRKRREFNFLIG